MQSSLRSLKNSELLTSTRELAQEERRITHHLIEHLREVERRMLFADLGYTSLLAFCVGELKMSSGAAHRRISAMRLVRDVPEVKASLLTGDLSLSNAAKIQMTFQAQKKIHAALEPAAKKEIAVQMMGLSQRECEVKLSEVLPLAFESLEQERERIAGPDRVELKLVFTHEQMERLKRLQDLYSHRFLGEGKWVALFDALATEELARAEKKRGLSRAEDKRNSSPVSKPVAIPSSESLLLQEFLEREREIPEHTCSEQELLKQKLLKEETSKQEIPKQEVSKQETSEQKTPKRGMPEQDRGARVFPAADLVETNQSDVGVSNETEVRSSGELPDPNRFNPSGKRACRKWIPRDLYREVWRRADGKCEFSGCGSQRFLQVDHRVPIAKGGDSSLVNLRLLCRAHNLGLARSELGEKFMRRYVPSLRS